MVANLRLHTFQDAAVATGNGVVFEVNDMASGIIDVQIATTATVTIEAIGPALGQLSTTGWVSYPVTNVTTGANAAAITATGLYRIDVNSLDAVRARVSTWTSGAVTAKGRFTDMADGGGGSASDTELPAAVAVPADNTEAISGLTIPVVRALLDVVDANGLINTTKLMGGYANGDAAGAATYKSLYVISQNYGFNGTTWDRLQVNANKMLKVEAGGVTKVIAATFTRPGDTTAYAAGDAVNNNSGGAGTVITFTSAARVSGGSGLIIAATMTKSTNGATGDSFDLHLFDTTVVLATDNAADVASDAEVLTYIGTINFSVATDLGANNRAYVASGLNLPFLTVGSANLFGKVVARGAYAPGNAEVFNIRLLLVQD